MENQTARKSATGKATEIFLDKTALKHERKTGVREPLMEGGEKKKLK